MFRYETFLLTLSESFRRKEERHNLLCCLIHLAPNSSGPHRAQGGLAPASSKIDPSRLVSSTPTLIFFKFSHKLLRASGAWRHPHPVDQYRLGLLWHLSDTSIRPRAPALTPASMLHPTNPCAEPKGSQPN